MNLIRCRDVMNISTASLAYIEVQEFARRRSLAKSFPVSESEKMHS